MVKRALLTQSWAEKERQRENGPGAKYLKRTAIKASKGTAGARGTRAKGPPKGSAYIYGLKHICNRGGTRLSI